MTVDPPDLTVEEGGSNTYTVVLDTRPSTGSVVVTVASDHSEVTATPARLTFSTGNWSTPKTVTVRAAADQDADDDAATLSHAIDAAATGAPEYDALTDLSGADVAVTVTDTQLSAPSNLRLVPRVGGLEVFWEAVRDADGYTVQWKTGSGAVRFQPAGRGGRRRDDDP